MSRSTRSSTASTTLQTGSASSTQALCIALTERLMVFEMGLWCQMRHRLFRQLSHRPHRIPLSPLRYRLQSHLRSRRRSRRPPRIPLSPLRYRRPPQILPNRPRSRQPPRIPPSHPRSRRPPRIPPSHPRSRRPPRILPSRLRPRRLSRIPPNRLRSHRPLLGLLSRPLFHQPLRCRPGPRRCRRRAPLLRLYLQVHRPQQPPLSPQPLARQQRQPIASPRAHQLCLSLSSTLPRRGRAPRTATATENPVLSLVS